MKLAVRTKRKKMKCSETNICDKIYKRLYTLCASQKEKRKKVKKGLFKVVMSENYPNLGMDVDIEIDEAQNTPS